MATVQDGAAVLWTHLPQSTSDVHLVLPVDLRESHIEKQTSRRKKRAKQVERADVHWLGKVNDFDRVVEIMGKVCWNNGTNIGQAQKRWCQRVAMRIDWGRTWVVAGWVTLPEDEKMAGRVWTLAS